MIAARTLVGSLGQGQLGASGLVPRGSLVQPESHARAAETGVDSLTLSRGRAEWRKGREFRRSTPASAAKASPYTDARPPFLPDRFGLSMIPSDVGLLSSTESRKASASAAWPEKAFPFRGRITGPVKFINQLLATWHLEPGSACALLGFEPSDSRSINDVLQGHVTLRGRDAKDRIAHLFQIRKLLSALFRDEAVENEWLREPRDMLKGKTPMELLLEGSMENLLLVREYVEFVTGR